MAGISRDVIADVKQMVAGLVSEPLPLESFHVKQRSDVKDGALLVPKVILAAGHRPGQKLIDEAGDEGQLDFVYDEVCHVGGQSDRRGAVFGI